MLKLEITMPVYNEELDVMTNIPRLYDFCEKNLAAYDWNIRIVDNASTDKTWKKIQELCEKFKPRVGRLHIDRKGRGWALRSAWKTSSADYVAYMDIDLSSELAGLPKMLTWLDHGYDLVTGSRNLPESKVNGRGLLRTIISKTYILLVKVLHRIKLSDTQCGFKALRRDAFLKIEPFIDNNLWFFDTEMIIIMEKAGFKLKDVPIEWTDNSGTTVKIARDSWEEFSGLIRLLKTRPWKTISNI